MWKILLLTIFVVACGQKETPKNNKTVSDNDVKKKDLTKQGDTSQSSTAPTIYTGNKTPVSKSSSPNPETKTYVQHDNGASTKQALGTTGQAMQTIGNTINQYSNGNQGAQIAGGIFDALGGIIGAAGGFAPGTVAQTPTYTPQPQQQPTEELPPHTRYEKGEVIPDDAIEEGALIIFD